MLYCLNIWAVSWHLLICMWESTKVVIIFHLLLIDTPTWLNLRHAEVQTTLLTWYPCVHVLGDVSVFSDNFFTGCVDYFLFLFGKGHGVWFLAELVELVKGLNWWNTWDFNHICWLSEWLIDCDLTWTATFQKWLIVMFVDNSWLLPFLDSIVFTLVFDVLVNVGGQVVLLVLNVQVARSQSHCWIVAASVRLNNFNVCFLKPLT